MQKGDEDRKGNLAWNERGLPKLEWGGGSVFLKKTCSVKKKIQTLGGGGLTCERIAQ